MHSYDSPGNHLQQSCTPEPERNPATDSSRQSADVGPAPRQVVAHERPDLQEQAASLSTQLASYTITLKELEDNLLQRLAASQVYHSSMVW